MKPKTVSYILEVRQGCTWQRFFIDCAWPTRRAAEAYCEHHLSSNDWPSRARVVVSSHPVSLPDHVAEWKP